ncbi:MAG: NAD(P)-dependent oxidoreductase [Nakamurella sp.]
MRILVTGSSGHLGEALSWMLRTDGHQVVGVDIRPDGGTDLVGSIDDRRFVRGVLAGVDAVMHTATLHKPHVGSHTRQDFVDTNISGTLTLLEESAAAGVSRFVFTSTTSSFGRALTPESGLPAAWITEDVVPRPRNIYGVSKIAAEDICELVHRDTGLPIVILRVSRFFPEADDSADISSSYSAANIQVNEMLYRRVDLEDVVDAHRCALDRAADIGFGRYIVSASTPFGPADLAELRRDAPAVVSRYHPDYRSVYRELGWRMFPHLDRVYVNQRARAELGWRPRYTFGHLLQRLVAGFSPRSALSLAVGAKGYHPVSTGPYTVR